jgi:hypothetical protein
MTTLPLRPPHRRQALAGLQAAVGSVARPNPFVVAWRWRYELTLAAGMITGVIALSRTPAAAWVVAGCAAAVAAAMLWPPARRLAVAWAWCVITPHRVRAGCTGAWIHSRGGKLPAVLLTKRKPFGERVHLWCHAGSCAQDFESARELLIAACWAQDMRVTCSNRHRQLVTLDVIRRPRSKPPSGVGDTSRMRSVEQAPPRVIRAAHQPAALPQNGHDEACRSELEYRIDETRSLFRDLNAGKDFYFSRRTFIFRQVVEKGPQDGH